MPFGRLWTSFQKPRVATRGFRKGSKRTSYVSHEIKCGPLVVDWVGATVLGTVAVRKLGRREKAEKIEMGVSSTQ